jgi:serine/threonine protein kinase
MSLRICKRCGTETETWSGTCAKCGGTEAISVVSGDLVGRTINKRFRLTRKLGQGGMGTVYEADDLNLGMRAAVKLMNPALSRDVDLSRRFMSEARTYAHIAHPGAVTLHDFGQDEDGTLYIAMEFVDGQTLKSLLDDRRRLPVDESVDIALQIASVLDFAHQKGVIHRDLKPDNVMVQRGLHGWHVKLLDFGVARRTFEKTRLTGVGGIAGTPRYMAPEQARGEEVDGRVDVFSLGLLLYECLTGFPAADPLSNEISIRSLGAVDPPLANSALDAVLARATHLDKAQRYGSMKEFAEGLRTAVGYRTPAHRLTPIGVPSVPPPIVPAPPSEPTYVPPERATPFPRAAKNAGREWAKWLAVALVIGSLGAAGGMVKRNVAPDVCPGIDIYDASFRELPIEELEYRVATLPIHMPSHARANLKALQVQVESYAPSNRACMYRLLLISSLVGARTVLNSTPSLWGLTRDLPRLRSLFLEMPLRENWSAAQRQSVLDQVDQLYVANLKADDDADRDFWRREYYGIALLCELTDAGLKELHAERPDSCLPLQPNEAAR